MNMQRITSVFILIILPFVLDAQRPKEYSFEIGDRFDVSSEIVQKIEQNNMGNVMITENDIYALDRLEVVDKSENSYKLKNTGIRRTLHMVSPFMTLDLNSDKTEEEHLGLRATTGKSYYFEIDKQGKLLSVSGLEAVRAAISEELEGTLHESAKKQILLSYDDEQLKKDLAQQFDLHSISTQDKWTKSGVVRYNGTPMNYTTEFTWYDELTLDGQGTISFESEDGEGDNAIKTELSGTQKSRTIMNPVTGLSEQVNITQSVDGTMKIMDTVIPTSIETTIEITIH